MYEFNPGKKIKLANGDEVEVVSKLGEGGQGVVYKVIYKDKEYALKWYFPKTLKSPDQFYKNLANNIANGSPAQQFLWPLAITDNQDDSFGYLMDLRPPEYKDFAHILNATEKYKDTTVVIDAMLNIVSAFQALHRNGYSYQDLNDGNFFINPQTGDILVCDNDNVAPYGESMGVSGKSRYMAPEVVLGKSRPNLDTDLFSLSVILFMMMFISHPLEGARVVSCPCLTEENEKKFYASEPVFIFDPYDSSNRPVRGIHRNAILFWPLYPSYLHGIFESAFTYGLTDIKKRPMETEWQKVLCRLKDDIITCPKCGEVNFASLEINDSISCCGCKHSINSPLWAKNANFEIALWPGKKITAMHIQAGDYSEIVGTVVQNKKKLNLWGIRNVSQRFWSVNFPNGVEKIVKSNEVVPILSGITINVGNTVLTI